jgi:hypothetical protein
MSEQPKITTAKEWRYLRENGQVVELPSGAVVKLRPISVSELIKTGKIPDELMSFALDIANSKDEDATKETIIEGIEVLNIVCQYMILEPKFTSDYDYEGDDLIPLVAMSEADKSFIYAWGVSPTIDFKSFREK